MLVCLMCRATDPVSQLQNAQKIQNRARLRIEKIIIIIIILGLESVSATEDVIETLQLGNIVAQLRRPIIAYSANPLLEQILNRLPRFFSADAQVPYRARVRCATTVT